MLRSFYHLFLTRVALVTTWVQRVLKNFFVQISFLLICLSLGAGFGFGFIQSNYLNESLLNQTLMQASLTAQSLANESFSAVQLEDYTGLYQNLYNFLETTNTANRAAIVNPEGFVIKGLSRELEGLRPLGSDVYFSDYSLVAKQLVSASSIQLWQPITDKGRVLAMVYLETDTLFLQTLSKNIWQRTIFSMTFILLLFLVILLSFLYRPMKALVLSNQFALSLDSNQGKTLTMTRLPSQFQNLVDGLNAASENLAQTSKEKNQMTATVNAVFEHSVDAIVIIDRDLLIRQFNKAAEQLFGYSADDIIGQPLQMLSPVPVSLEMRDAMGATRNLKVPAIRKNGETILLEVSDNEIEIGGERLFLSFMRDITEASKQRKAARAANEENSKLAVIANNSSHAVAIINIKSQGQHEWVNQSFTDMTGYSLEEAIGKTADELLFKKEVQAEDRLLFSEEIDLGSREEILEKMMRSESFKAQEVAYDKYGKQLLVVFEGYPVLTKGECSHYIIMWRDVTQERQKAVELRQAKEQAEQLLASQQLLLSRVSHEFRTPLNSIIGYTQLLEFGELDQEQYDHLRLISKGAKEILTLVDTVMAITPTETPESSELGLSFSLSILIRDLIASMASLAQVKHIQTVFDETQDVWVFADAQKLRRILEEILSNAYKFNKEGGLVFIELKEKEAKLEIVINDTGIGIEASVLTQLFDPFFRLEHDSDDVGAGLGLTVAHHLSEILQAELNASSVLGKGTVFTLSLPQVALSNAELGSSDSDYVHP